MRDRNGAREIGGEDERAFEDRDEDEIAGAVVGGDPRPELGDAGLDLRAGEVDLAGARAAYEAGFRPYFWARRSKSRRVKSLMVTSGYCSLSFLIFRFLRVMSDCFITVTSR